MNNLYPTATRLHKELQWLLAYFDAEVSISDGTTRDLARTFLKGVKGYEDESVENIIRKISEYWMQDDQDKEGYQKMGFLEQCANRALAPADAEAVWNEAVTYKQHNL